LYERRKYISLIQDLTPQKIGNVVAYPSDLSSESAKDPEIYFITFPYMADFAKGDKVFVLFGSDGDRAGQIGTVENVYDPHTIDPEYEGHERPVVTVLFTDNTDETFTEEELAHYSKARYFWYYARANWKIFIKEILAAIIIGAIILALIFFFSLFKGKPHAEAPKPIDPIVQLGQLKAEKEIKRSESLARQRDLKRQLEASYVEVTEYDTAIA
jgi:hypothetical protein